MAARQAKHQKKVNVINFRVSDDLKKTLEKAAAASGRPVSAEIEFQLRRSLFDWGTGPTHALMALIGKNIDNLMRLKGGSTRWWTDPHLFALAAESVRANFDMWRPQGQPPADIDSTIIDFVRQSMLREVEQADLTKPFEKQTAHEKWLAKVREDLGPLALQPLTWGKSAAELHVLEAQTKPILDEYKVLSRKEAAILSHTEALCRTDLKAEDRKRLERELDGLEPLTPEEKIRLQELLRQLKAIR
jgi:hypothetical protein